MVISRMPSIMLSPLRLAPAFVWAFALLGSLVSAHAQSIRWYPDRGTLGVGQSAELRLIFQDCAPRDTPAVPTVVGLSLEYAGTSQSTEIVNMNVTRRVIVTYMARPVQRGSLKIPTFEVQTDKGPVRVPPAEFEVGNATVGQTGASLEAIARNELVPPTHSVWAGEVFPLTYSLSIARRFNPQLASAVEWAPAPLVAEEWGKAEITESMQGGEPRILVTHRTRAYAKGAGIVNLSPAQQLVNLQTGTSAFGLFARPTMEQFTLTTEPVNVIVKPLPTPAPANFSGAVGQFVLNSKVVPTQAAVGEPVTWTVSLAGVGNWPDISRLPARDVSKDFRVVQPQAQQTPKEGALFEATLSEDVVLIPSRAGRYVLGPLRWTYFDPKAGEYRTLTTDAVPITISPPVAPAPAAPAPDPSSNAPSGTSPATPEQPQTAPVAPEMNLRDPLSGSDTVGAPFTTRVLWLAAGLASSLVVVTWIALAYVRARRLDPLRPRREALIRLRSTLDQLASPQTPSDQPKPLLRAWQKEVLVLADSPRAHPTPHEIARGRDWTLPDRESWAQLWRESEAALYGSRGTLPDDWVARARSVVEKQSIPGFRVTHLRHFRHWWPLATVWLVVGLADAGPRLVASPVDQYSSGNYAEATKGWTQQLRGSPTDWIARHNLALALAQTDRWKQAAGHALASFVQNPAHESTRWHLGYFWARAGYAPSHLTAFAQPGPLEYLAQTQSPHRWQITLLLGGALASAAVVLLLFRRYLVLPGWTRWAQPGLLALASALIVLSLVSLQRYGPATDRRAVIVHENTVLRSIPTTADTSQKTTPLAAGSMAVVDRALLDWRRLVFENGQTGWVRSDEIIGLWTWQTTPPPEMPGATL